MSLSSSPRLIIVKTSNLSYVSNFTHNRKIQYIKQEWTLILKENYFAFKVNEISFNFSPWADTFSWLALGDKIWYGFLVTSGCLLLRKVWCAVRIGSFIRNWGILQTRMEQSGDQMKMNFDYFQIQKWMLETARAGKVDEKIGSFV